MPAGSNILVKLWEHEHVRNSLLVEEHILGISPTVRFPADSGAQLVATDTPPKPVSETHPRALCPPCQDMLERLLQSGVQLYQFLLDATRMSFARSTRRAAPSSSCARRSESSRQGDLATFIEAVAILAQAILAQGHYIQNRMREFGVPSARWVNPLGKRRAEDKENVDESR